MLLSLARSELTQREKARNREGSWSRAGRIYAVKLLFTICNLREINSRRNEVCATNSDTLKSLASPKLVLLSESFVSSTLSWLFSIVLV